MFLQGDLMQAVEHSTIQELLTLSQDPKNILYAYKEIRQEVSFLASLNSPFLTGKPDCTHGRATVYMAVPAYLCIYVFVSF